MCDIAAERAKIDRLLLECLAETPRLTRRDLSEAAMRKLLEHYGDACPDQCLAHRIDDFVHAVLAAGGRPPGAERACA